MIFYIAVFLMICQQSIPASSFLLKCETVVEEEIPSNETHTKDTVAADDGAVIDMYDDYKITSAGIHKIHKTGENWNSARNICLDEKAHLAIINSAAEEALITKYMKDQNIGSMWIGVHDIFENNQWTLVTGDRLYSLDYVHWSKNEPNNAGSGEQCVHISQTGMNDLSCNVQLYFICEKINIV